MQDNIPLYQVDAFADKLFAGNPAAVCPLESWLPDTLLQAIAEENNLSETAFLVQQNPTTYQLRWFTPLHEVDLCGHATLAAAHVLYDCQGYTRPEIQFETRSGRLIVHREEGKYRMDFPNDLPSPREYPGLEEVLGCSILHTCKGVSDILVEVENEAVVATVKPDFRALAAYDARGLIITAPGNSIDIVSRCFYPAYGIDEDPVTGSAHTTLFSYWGAKWGNTSLSAMQLSPRGGWVLGELKKDRVWLTGTAVLYLQGTIFLPE